jgi:hypothetical protein
MSNIFSRASKAFTDVLAIARASSHPIINISSAPDYEKIPFGFFRVQLASGKEVLGYKDPPLTIVEFVSEFVDGEVKQRRVERKVASPFGHTWPVSEIVNLGGGRIVRLEIPRAALKVVRFSYRSQSDGVAQVGNHLILDTEALSKQFDDTVGWDGAPHRDGVEWR